MKVKPSLLPCTFSVALRSTLCGLLGCTLSIALQASALTPPSEITAAAVTAEVTKPATAPDESAAERSPEQTRSSPEPAFNTTPCINRNVEPMIAIIIDDMGHHLQRGTDALALPGRLTYAIIPFTAHSQRLASAAQSRGKEVMLHAPMSTLNGTPLGRNGLTADLSREEFLRNLRMALAAVPQAEGVNNHMGSDLTQRRQQMAWLMQELRWRDLYFVDSRTSDKTVAAVVATEFNVPQLSRQVFLDNEANADAIAQRFAVLVKRAREDGLAVAIGHPYRATINYLQQALPELEAQGVRTVYVSEAIEYLTDATNTQDCAEQDAPAQP